MTQPGDSTDERARQILEHIVKIAVDQQAQLTDAYGTFSSFRFTKWIKERPELLEFARTGEKEAIEILKNLCQLKHHKDTVGKDSFYNRQQPLAWKKANEFLNSLVSSPDKTR